MSQKTRIDWEDVLDSIPEIVRQYDTRLTLRQLYYRLVAALKLPNLINAYKGLSAKLVKARESGDLPWDVIEDRSREARVSSIWNGTAQTSPDELRENIISAVRRELFDSFYYDRWHKQPELVEVWYEKEALEALFQKICNRFSVTSFACKGYPSATKLKEAADRLNRQANGRQCTILYFGDFDPSGKDIPRYIKEKLQEEHGIDVELEVKALHLEQIKKHGFPTMPVKKKDVRAEKFIEKYGSGVVELDAVPPDMLQGWITAAIADYFDNDLYDKWQAIGDRRTTGYRSRARLALEEVLKDTGALIEAIEEELE